MLLVFCELYSPRLQYVLNWIFSRWGISFEVTHDIEKYTSFEGAKISYQRLTIDEGELSIRSTGFLDQPDLKRIELNPGKTGEMPVLFRDESAFGFDIFSAVFFMLSRYEEYLPFEADSHGRFPARISVAYRLGFLEIPVVDVWLSYFKAAIERRYPAINFKQEQFTPLFTYDIDVAFKYRGKNFFRQAGGLLKDIAGFSFKKVNERLNVAFGKAKDPWDTFTEILTDLHLKNMEALFFFPASNHSRFDNNLSPEVNAVRNLIEKLKSRGRIGLHPSYYSTEKPVLVSKEKARLEKVAGQDIIDSRQHFLKFKLPETFLTLIECGIKNDYSMCFPEMPGFRAGTSHPFNFYDLKNEKSTDLKIFPGCCMDHTFIHYLKKDAVESLEQIRNILGEIRKYNGMFIPIFHNHCLADKKWLWLHNELIKEV